MARFGTPAQNTNTLAYTDQRLANVPCVQASREPTINDKNYPLWTEWRVTKNPASGEEGDWWKLIKFTAGDAIWVKISGDEGAVVTLSDTAGTKVEADADGNIQLYSSDASVSLISDPANNRMDVTLPDGPETAMANFIVDPNDIKAEYTTIASAIAAASSGDTIGIKPGVYDEDLTLKAGVVITALGGSSEAGTVNIQGKATATDTGNYVIYGCQLTADSGTPDNFLEITGSNTLTVSLEQCRLVANGATGISINNANANVDIDRCDGDVASAATKFHDVIAGKLEMRRCRFTNTGGSTTASTYAGAAINGIHYSQINYPISVSGTCILAGQDSNFDCSSTNTTAIVFNSSGVCNFNRSSFNGGTSPAVTVSDNLTLTNSTVSSTNATAAINGAGPLTYSNVIFTNTSNEITANTQVLLFRGNSDLVGGRATGKLNYILSQNTDITDTSSNASIEAKTGTANSGNTSGDPYLRVNVDGYQVYNLGIDNSDMDAFKITDGTGANAGPSGGNVHLRLTAGGNLSFDYGTSFLRIQRGTTAQRPSTPLEAMMRGNTSTNILEYYDGTGWIRQVQRRQSFTPALEFGGASTGITYSNQIGNSQIIGNTIWFELQINLTNKGSATGTATITGLPASTTILCPCYITCSNLTFSGQVAAQASTSGVIQLVNLTSGGALASLDDTAFANNTLVRVVGQYSIASV